MDIIRVTDDTTRDQIAEACGHVCASAKRLPRVVGTAECPTLWDRLHAKLDVLLDEWQASA